MNFNTKVTKRKSQRKIISQKIQSNNSQHSMSKYKYKYLISICSTLFILIQIKCNNNSTKVAFVSNPVIKAENRIIDSSSPVKQMDSMQDVMDTLIGPLKVKLNPKEYVYGLDVSHVQGSKIDWARLKSVGLKFTFIKLFDPAWLGSTFRKRDRENYYDRALAQSIDAKSNNLKIGYYHYCRPPKYIPTSLKEHAENQACLFLERVYIHEFQYNVNPDFPLVVDFESHDNESSVIQKNAAWLNDWLFHLVKVLELNGYQVMIYSNKHSIEAGLPKAHNFSNYPYWTAGYPRFHINSFPKKYELPGWNEDWKIWQFSDVFLVEGVCNNDYVNKFKDLNSIIDKHQLKIANARVLYGKYWKDSLKAIIKIEPDKLPYCDINIMKRNFFNSF